MLLTLVDQSAVDVETLSLVDFVPRMAAYFVLVGYLQIAVAVPGVIIAAYVYRQLFAEVVFEAVATAAIFGDLANSSLVDPVNST